MTLNLTSIEKIDLGAASNNTFRLRAQDLLDLVGDHIPGLPAGEASNHVLQVTGANGGTVNALNATGYNWTDGGVGTVLAGYHTYFVAAAHATLLIDTHITSQSIV